MSNEELKNDTNLSENDQTQPEKKKVSKKDQMQLFQEALGLAPQDVKLMEKKLFIARSLDYLSEETFDFIYKDKTIDSYENEIGGLFKELAEIKEENKLLAKQYEEKGIYNKVRKLKEKAEKVAAENDITKPIEKKLKTLSLIITIPSFVVLMILTFLLPLIYMFPLLCLFCMLPRILQSSIAKKWFAFKEAHKQEFYAENREDIMDIKKFIGDILNDLRSELLEKEVPLQLISFPLYSNDYENLDMKNRKATRSGGTQYIFSFEYPPGMEPFPIPEALQQQYQQPSMKPSPEKSEKNFIVLNELKAEDGVIKSFVPTLKDRLADKINTLLDDCEFEKSKKDLSEIIPGYGDDQAIYCVCGGLAEIEDIQFVTYKISNEKDFHFYLFEGGSCKCQEKIYALSLIDDDQKVPDEFKEIFEN